MISEGEVYALERLDVSIVMLNLIQYHNQTEKYPRTAQYSLSRSI